MENKVTCEHKHVSMGYLDDLYCDDCGKFLGGIGGYFDSGDMPPDEVLNDWWNGKLDVSVGLNSWRERVQEKN